MPNHYDFRFQFGASSPYVPLLRYLSPKNKSLTAPRQQMIIWAVAAFWYPLARRWEGELSESELKIEARTAIHQLQQQIVYLTRIFDLERESLTLDREFILDREKIDDLTHLNNPLATNAELTDSVLTNSDVPQEKYDDEDLANSLFS